MKPEDEKELFDLHHFDRLRFDEGIQKIKLTSPKEKEHSLDIFLQFYASRNILIYALILTLCNAIWFTYFLFSRYTTNQSNPIGRALGNFSFTSNNSFLPLHFFTKSQQIHFDT